MYTDHPIMKDECTLNGSEVRWLIGPFEWMRNILTVRLVVDVKPKGNGSARHECLPREPFGVER